MCLTELVNMLAAELSPICAVRVYISTYITSADKDHIIPFHHHPSIETMRGLQLHALRVDDDRVRCIPNDRVF